MNYNQYSQFNNNKISAKYLKSLNTITKNFTKSDLHNEEEYFKLYTISTKHSFVKDFSSCINLFKVSPSAREALWNYDLPTSDVESELSTEQIHQIKNIASICFFSDLVKCVMHK